MITFWRYHKFIRSLCIFLKQFSFICNLDYIYIFITMIFYHIAVSEKEIVLHPFSSDITIKIIFHNCNYSSLEWILLCWCRILGCFWQANGFSLSKGPVWWFHSHEIIWNVWWSFKIFILFHIRWKDNWSWLLTCKKKYTKMTWNLVKHLLMMKSIIKHKTDFIQSYLLTD